MADEQTTVLEQAWVSDTITSVRAVPISIPLETPLRFSTREVHARQYLLVFVETSGGLSGVGYTYIGTAGARAAAALLEEVLAPRLVGQPAYGPERTWPALFQETLLLGRRGLVMRAMSAIDIALWDLLGKAAGLPLYVLLGGVRDEVPAYGSGGYYRPGDPLENVRHGLAQYIAQGFSDFKIKVGGAPFEVDVARVRVARETIGPVGRLALDANNVWHTPAEAIRFIRVVEPYDIWWVEEPLPPDDIPGHAEVARTVDVPIATGEIHATRWEFRDNILAKAADILQPDAGVVGGITEWMKITHAAQTFGLLVAPHWNADIHVHLAGAAGDVLTVEYFALEQDVFNFERILGERLKPAGGLIKIPQRPGLGLMLDDVEIERFRL